MKVKIHAHQGNDNRVSKDRDIIQTPVQDWDEIIISDQDGAIKFKKKSVLADPKLFPRTVVTNMVCLNLFKSSGSD